MSRDVDQGVSGSANHERWLEAAAAYALDALDANERAEFEGHLAACAECRLAVQEYREVTGLLMHASVPAEAPASLRDRVGAMVREEASRAHPSPPDIAPRATSSTPVAAQPTRAARASRAPVYWLAAASLVLAATSALLYRDVRSARDERSAALLAVRALERSVAERESLLVNLQGPRVHVVSLAGTDGSASVARVFWNHTRRRFVVDAYRLPPAREGRVYQLWAIADGKAPVSMGTFNADRSGTATVVLPVGRDVEALGTLTLCAITEEPAGGSAGPTESPRYAGTWTHAD